MKLSIKYSQDTLYPCTLWYVHSKQMSICIKRASYLSNLAYKKGKNGTYKSIYWDTYLSVGTCINLPQLNVGMFFARFRP